MDLLKQSRRSFLKTTSTVVIAAAATGLFTGLVNAATTYYSDGSMACSNVLNVGKFKVAVWEVGDPDPKAYCYKVFECRDDYGSSLGVFKEGPVKCGLFENGIHCSGVSENPAHEYEYLNRAHCTILES